ncbi:MAG: TolC family protein [Kiritimatiellae bacterium]|nr:TolC family protein [Kiritimatiellia bacterium]
MKDRKRAMAAIVPLAVVLCWQAPTAGAVTLEECIAAALRHSPDVQAALERVSAAEAAARQAHSAYYPMLGAAAGYALTDNPPQAFMMQLNQRAFTMESDFNNPDDTDNLALSLGLKYRLCDFGRRGLDSEMAAAAANASKCVLRGLQNELIHQVTRGYYAVLQAGAFVTVREETCKTLEESLRVANERLRAGSAVKSDVLNLEVQLAQAREELIRARNGVTLALIALDTAIGVPMVKYSEIVKQAAPSAQRPPDELDQRAWQKRPELLAARQMAAVRRLAARKARRQYLPTLNAFGSLDWNSGLSSGFEDSYVAGVAAEVEIFDGFRRDASIVESDAQARVAVAEVESASNRLRLDLATAALRAEEAWERYEVARKSIESAEESLRVTQQRYQQGAADLPELLTAQTGLTGTRTRNIAALYDCLINLSNLERAQGLLVGRYAAECPDTGTVEKTP